MVDHQEVVFLRDVCRFWRPIPQHRQQVSSCQGYALRAWFRQGRFSRRACRTHAVHYLILFPARCVSEQVAIPKSSCLPLLVCLLGMPCTHGSPPSHLLRRMLRRTQRRSQRHRGRHCSSSQLGIRHARVHHNLVCAAGVASPVARSRRHRGHKGWCSWRTRRTFEVHHLLHFTASCSVAKVSIPES